VWLPLRATMAIESGPSSLETRTWWWANAVIRLRPGTDDESANAQLLGTLLAAAAGRFVEGLLFDVRSNDPVVFVLVVLVLSASGLVAAIGPAWRASAVSPATALQAE